MNARVFWKAIDKSKHQVYTARKKPFKGLCFFMLILLISVIITPIAFANSAEPPAVTIIVSFPPDDLSLSIRFADGSLTDAVQLQKEEKAWETYYRFFYGIVSPTLVRDNQRHGCFFSYLSV